MHRVECEPKQGKKKNKHKFYVKVVVLNVWVTPAPRGSPKTLEYTDIYNHISSKISYEVTKKNNIIEELY